MSLSEREVEDVSTKSFPPIFCGPPQHPQELLQKKHLHPLLSSIILFLLLFLLFFLFVMGNKQASLTEEGHQIQPDDFEFIRLIGRGGFAKVFQVRKRDTGSIYAMKIMQKVAVLRTNMIRHTNLLVSLSTS
jgi:serine/threonine protein kinase